MQKKHIPREKESCKYGHENMTMGAQFFTHWVANTALCKTKVPKDALQVALKEVGKRYEDGIKETQHTITETKKEVGIVPESSTVPCEGTVMVQVRHGTLTDLAIVGSSRLPFSSSFGDVFDDI